MQVFEIDVTKQTVELKVNGQPSNLELDPRTSLLDAFRDWHGRR